MKTILALTLCAMIAGCGMDGNTQSTLKYISDNQHELEVMVLGLYERGFTEGEYTGKQKIRDSILVVKLQDSLAACREQK